MVVKVYIHRFYCFCMLNGSRTLSGSSVNEISCYCPGGCRGNISWFSASECCHVLVYQCLRSSATHITEDARPTIIDAHFHNGPGKLSIAVFPIKAANNFYMTVCNLSPIGLHRRQDQTLLTLRWCSFSGWGLERVSMIIAYIGGQYFDFV